MKRYELVKKDCITFLESLESQSVDLCITDPAYESLEKHRAVGTTTRLKESDGSSNKWFEIFKNERFPPMMRELYRVLKKDAHLYVFADEETTFDVTKPTGKAAGFTWWKAIDWIKTKNGTTSDPEELVLEDVNAGMGYHWRNSKEHIGFLEKGKRKLNNLGWPDVIPAPRVRNGYPTEKPVEVIEKLVLNSSLPTDLVIDIFMGSGSTGEAALKHGRNFAGCDISDAAMELAEDRLLSAGGRRDRVLVPRRQAGLFG